MRLPPSSDRDSPLSEYVRFRITEHVDAWVEKHGSDRGSLQELVTKSRGLLSRSGPAMVKRGGGVGARALPGYAKAFGFSSAEELQQTASQWYLQRTRGAELKGLSPAQTEAVDQLAKMGHGTREQLRHILGAYTHPRFAERDAAWWISTLFDELRFEGAWKALEPKPASAVPTLVTKIRK